MSFANLLKQEESFEIGSVKVKIKKFSYAFTEWLSLKSYEGRTLKVNKSQKDSMIIEDAGEKSSYRVAPREKILEAVTWWDLHDEAGVNAPINAETVGELLEGYPEFCEALLLKIDAFNILDASKKKS